MLRKFRMVAASVLAVVACHGCNSRSEPEAYPVSGRVTVEGSPLTQGTIRFVPASGRPATSAIGPDGSFNLGLPRVGGVGIDEGIPPGAYRVTVAASEVIDAEAEEVRWLAPRRYADFRTSGLEVNVDGPLDEVAIDLSWADDEQTAADQESGGEVDDNESEDDAAESRDDVTLESKQDGGGGAQ